MTVASRRTCSAQASPPCSQTWVFTQSKSTTTQCNATLPVLPRPSGASSVGGSASSVSVEIEETKADVMTITPNAKRDRGSTSDSACADDLDGAASMASSGHEVPQWHQQGDTLGRHQEAGHNPVVVGHGSGPHQQRRRGRT